MSSSQIDGIVEQIMAWGNQPPPADDEEAAQDIAAAAVLIRSLEAVFAEWSDRFTATGVHVAYAPCTHEAAEGLGSVAGELESRSVLDWLIEQYSRWRDLRGGTG